MLDVLDNIMVHVLYIRQAVQVKPNLMYDDHIMRRQFVFHYFAAVLLSS
jgi:hypothetical protein